MEKYKIVVGTSDNKTTTQEQYNLVNKHSIDVNINIYKMDNEELYSVEAGPYSAKKEMLQDLDQIKGLGITNAFITNA